jgi:DNA-binding NtrC family response regulator
VINLKTAKALGVKIPAHLFMVADNRLMAHDWPGNVRELANVIERAIVLGHGPKITPEDLPHQLAFPAPEKMSDSLSYRHALDSAGREVIKRALASTRGNRTAAARILGLHKTHLLNLIKSLGIE